MREDAIFVAGYAVSHGLDSMQSREENDRTFKGSVILH